MLAVITVVVHYATEIDIHAHIAIDASLPSCSKGSSSSSSSSASAFFLSSAWLAIDNNANYYMHATSYALVATEEATSFHVIPALSTQA